MSASTVCAAYGRRASEYIDLFGDIVTAAAVDRVAALEWARSVDGTVLDVGCGPGHWTKYLSDHGVTVEGVDPTPEFISCAQERFPGLVFRIGHAEDLDVDEASVGGIFSWYSLIHLAPERIPAALTEFARCVRPGGGLTVGFFEGPQLEPFAHAVVTAYKWPIDLLAAHIETAGFIVTDACTRSEPGARKQGTIRARRQVK